MQGRVNDCNEYEEMIAEHYQHGNLLTAIFEVLKAQGKNITQLSLADLAPIDEFHIGGPKASEHFFSQLNFNRHSHVLDIGCGLGGAARFLAHHYQSKVTGVDLTAEYVNTGNELSKLLNLTKRVNLQQASAVALPFTSESFNGAYMMHVGMNIENKETFFKAISSVLTQQAYFGIYDVMQQTTTAPTYPLPWADNEKYSYITTLAEYKSALLTAGFEIVKINNRQQFALDFFAQVREQNKNEHTQPRLGLPMLMKSSSHKKLHNLRNNIKENIIAPFEIIARKCS